MAKLGLGSANGFLAVTRTQETKDRSRKLSVIRNLCFQVHSQIVCVCGGEILQNRRDYYQIGKQLRDKAEVQIKFNS